jgi:hypothetical protein
MFRDRKAAECLKFIEIMYKMCLCNEAQQILRVSGLTNVTAT